jgi:hypothetical protein
LESLDVIFTKQEPKDVTLSYNGIEIKLKVRELSWTEKTKILSESFKYNDKGMAFNFDYYMKTALSKIIVEAPWGKTDQIFFTKINSTFGALLETLVPKAFAEGQKPADFFESEQSS